MIKAIGEDVCMVRPGLITDEALDMKQELNRAVGEGSSGERSSAKKEFASLKKNGLSESSGKDDADNTHKKKRRN